MASSFDPYREALVVECVTHWPAELTRVAPPARPGVEERLHADARHAAQLAYVRLHTGFCREITVTEDDLHRLGV